MGVGPDVSSAITAQHRILRRGRVYGEPAASDWLPRSIAADTEPPSVGGTTGDRGLLFMCLCADIEQQFEFIQQTWLNNSKHAGLFAEVDPIAAGNGLADDGQRFTIPRDALRRRIGGIPRTVTVRGAGYFLLPGRKALLALLVP
jgi:deferrochelatase/peroxidase EfeB